MGRTEPSSAKPSLYVHACLRKVVENRMRLSVLSQICQACLLLSVAQHQMIAADTDRALERERMVQKQLIARGISDKATLAAMRSVPRDQFVPEAWQREAYTDQPLPLGYGQTI